MIDGKVEKRPDTTSMTLESAYIPRQEFRNQKRRQRNVDLTVDSLASARLESSLPVRHDEDTFQKNDSADSSPNLLQDVRENDCGGDSLNQEDPTEPETINALRPANRKALPDIQEIKKAVDLMNVHITAFDTTRSTPLSPRSPSSTPEPKDNGSTFDLVVELQTQVFTLQQQNSILRESENQLRQDNISLRNDNIILRDDNKNLRQSNDGLRALNEVTHLERQLNALTRRLAERGSP